MEFLPAEHPRPRHFILHISDTHLLGDDGPLYGAVDSRERLEQLFDRLCSAQMRPDAIVFTGDLADRGERGAYAALAEIVRPVAEEMGARLIYAVGNHDDRAGLKAELLGEPGDPRPLDRVYDVNGLRIITLDTSVPGYHHGELDPAQLQWLRGQLATSAPHGTILAMHHPPVPSVQDLTVLVELREQSRLAEALAGSDVRSIIAGHLHYSTFSTFAGIPVSVASATCYTQDLASPGTRGQDAAQGCNMVHVYDSAVVHSVMPLERESTVGEAVGPAETAKRLEQAGVQIPGLRQLASS